MKFEFRNSHQRRKVGGRQASSYKKFQKAGVGGDREITYVAACVEVKQKLTGDLHEDDLLLDARREHVTVLEIFGLLARLNEEQRLALDCLGIRRA